MPSWVERRDVSDVGYVVPVYLVWSSGGGMLNGVVEGLTGDRVKEWNIRSLRKVDDEFTKIEETDSTRSIVALMNLQTTSGSRYKIVNVLITTTDLTLAINFYHEQGRSSGGSPPSTVRGLRQVPWFD
ncbi:hypothetical protein E3N88_30042 [Mikania micrantha]|uniref:Uncharacterized protein n=1 Tax=Mikania micrantha TaxID=192012 RepID=A0A5N6MLF6_9ASTR|nr:hypothetical protein E3N88_30042 [Mikania micrantha]